MTMNQYPQYPQPTWTYNARPMPSRIITRPPFPHGKHIGLTFMTLGMWLPVYGIAYTWHRFGPTKSVTTWR
jgi:hypothetical protein